MLKKITILSVVLILLAGGYAYASQKGMLPDSLPKLELEKTGISAPELTTLQSQVGTQMGTLSTRAQELGNHAKNVLGTSVQVDETQQPLHERAIEYTQYVYCQQVVQSYEKLHQ